MKKIAFLFLIYDIINLEELWNIFFMNVDKNKYNIYIHYKYDTKLKYFENYKLNNCIPTNYADKSIVKAMNILLSEASKDIENEHFIILSGACIPFKNFNHIYNNLDVHKSYFNIAPQSQCFPLCNALLPFIDIKNIQKSSQFFILNKKHTNIILKNNFHIDLYDNVYAPDEVYFITSMYCNNLQDEIITTPNSANDATTFTNWEGMDYKFPSYRGLKNYDIITHEELSYLINSKCFFGRKFNEKCFLYLANEEYISAIMS